MGFESMPTGKPAKTEEEIEASRRENALQFEDQADARNENRGVVKKVFGIGKESGIDIAQEEASRMNRLVDQKIERDGAEVSAQTASEEIARSSEFDRKDEATIKAEEFLKSKNPDITKSIQGGDVTSARAVFEKLSEKVKDDNERRSLRRGFEKMVSGQVDTLVQSDDLEGMKKLIKENKVYDIGPQNIALMPQEIIQSPIVQGQLFTGIENVFSGNREFGLNKANEYVKLGLISKESAQKLFQSEGFQKKLTGDIENVFSGNREFGLNKANEYVKLGLMTPERANQVISNLRAKKAA